MSFFSKEKVKKELVLVFDVGSSSVGGAVFETQESGSPKIISSIRQPIVLEEKLNVEQFFKGTIKALEMVSDKIFAEKIGAPDKIYCVLSSPWYASQSRTIKYQKNTPFVFNSKLADSLIEKEVSLFREQHLSPYQGSPDEVRQIEFKNMETTLNGYPTSDPLNKKAKEVEMTVFVSMSPEQVLKKIEGTIGRHFSVKIKFSSLVMSFFVVVRDMLVYQENFLLINIGGEVTDIYMAKKDVLCESVSFPMGINFMIRGVASALNCSLDNAKSALYLYKDGHADATTEKKIKPIVEGLRSVWLKKFQESLTNLSGDISIPSNIFVAIEQDLASFFAEIIKNEQFNQYSLTESKFKVFFLGTEALHAVADFHGNGVYDPFLIIESIYISRFLR